MSCRRAWLMMVVGVLLMASSCTGLLSGIAKVAQGAQLIAGLVDVAQIGSAQYFDRHPNMEREHKINAKIRQARIALALLDAAATAAKAADAGDVVAARAGVLDAYDGLRGLLDEFGVLTATPPAGGAETDAPTPSPILLPTRAELAGSI
jgi:hypothetical protein